MSGGDLAISYLRVIKMAGEVIYVLIGNIAKRTKVVGYGPNNIDFRIQKQSGGVFRETGPSRGLYAKSIIKFSFYMENQTNNRKGYQVCWVWVW